MTILNSYIVGQPEIAQAIAVGIVGLICCGFLIGLAIDLREGAYAFFIIPILFVVGIVGIHLIQDNSRPRIETLIDDFTPFVQINDTYKFIEQRDSIYIFDVREGTAEYEELMGELQNENR